MQSGACWANEEELVVDFLVADCMREAASVRETILAVRRCKTRRTHRLLAPRHYLWAIQGLVPEQSEV